MIKVIIALSFFNGEHIEWNEACKHMAFYLIGMNIVTLNQRKHEHLSS